MSGGATARDSGFQIVFLHVLVIRLQPGSADTRRRHKKRGGATITIENMDDTEFVLLAESLARVIDCVLGCCSVPSLSNQDFRSLVEAQRKIAQDSAAQAAVDHLTAEEKRAAKSTKKKQRSEWYKKYVRNCTPPPPPPTLAPLLSPETRLASY